MTHPVSQYMEVTPFPPRLNHIRSRPFYCLKSSEIPPKISGTIEGSTMKLCTLIALLKATRIHKEIFRNLTYDVTMMSLLKTMVKIGPP